MYEGRAHYAELHVSFFFNSDCINLQKEGVGEV